MCHITDTIRAEAQQARDDAARMRDDAARKRSYADNADAEAAKREAQAVEFDRAADMYASTVRITMAGKFETNEIVSAV